MTAAEKPAMRVGPRMAEVREYVRAHPGCSQQEASLSLRYGPHGEGTSNMYGSDVIQRALAAGIIVDRRLPGESWRRYRLFVTRQEV